MLIDITPFLLRDSHHLADRLSSSDRAILGPTKHARLFICPIPKASRKIREFEAIITLAGNGTGKRDQLGNAGCEFGDGTDAPLLYQTAR